MAFLKVGGTVKKKQRLYVFNIVLPSGMTVVKLGKASGESSKERMLQINSSIFDKHRCTAMISIKRDREVPAADVFKMESTLHRFFVNYRYESKTKFDGITECFVIPLEDAVQAMEAVVGGLTPDHVYELPDIAVDDLPF